MAKHILIAFTNPVEGQDDAYHDWYDTTHISEILSVPGIVSARRFKIKMADVKGGPAWKFVAIYEVETDNLSETLKTLGATTGDVVSALDQSTSGTIVATEILSRSENGRA
jgi:hypothetical protein